MLLRSRTLGMHVRFGATLHAPRVARARNSRSVGVYPARSEGCVLSECALTLRLSRMLRGLRTLGMHLHYEAILHAPRVVYSLNKLHFEAIPHAPRVAYPQKASSL